MPNWCFTSYRIEGKPETLKKIYDAILHHEVQKNSSPNWEGNVLKALGITWEDKPSDNANRKYLRGFIQESPSLGENVLEVYAEEAWQVSDFGELLEENFSDVKVYYSGEEQDMDYLVTNDSEGKYFRCRAIVECCINDEYKHEEFTSIEKAYQWIYDNTPCKTKEDIENFGSDSKDSPDDFINIYEYKIVK